MPQTLSVGLVQMSMGPTTAQNLALAEHYIRNAASQGAKLVVLPELFATPYFCQTKDHDAFDLAEPVNGPLVTRMQQVAKDLGVVLIVPFFERDPVMTGVYYNAAAVIEADGTCLGVYRKTHIPDDPGYDEKFYFTPGGPPKVFPTSVGRIGVLICWDQWFPEAARLLALAGAEIAVVPTAIGWHPHEKAQWGDQQLQAWLGVQRGHAIANTLFWIAVNRTGHEPGPFPLEFWGSSVVFDPYGRTQFQAPHDQEGGFVVPLDLAKIEESRRHWPFLRDRQPHHYTGLVR